MGYKALYRKYRPDSFDSIVGQPAIIRTLQNIIKGNKISHAYLFGGPRGTGKTSIAKIFAKAINCLNPQDGMPCNGCSICKQIKEERLNDIIEIDAASNNGVDEIRDLKSKINLAPTICKYKVYIIDEVHMLSIGAFNALLKTLEEPPQHVVFILATTEMHKLPLTIISRCQNFNFKKITEEQMRLRLDYIASQEHIAVDSEALYEIAKVSDGGMRDAIGLLEQSISFTDNNITLQDVQLLSASVSRSDIVDIIENVIDGNVEAIFQNVERLYQEGKDFIKIAEDLIVFLKDVILHKKAEKYFKEKSTYDIEVYSTLLNKLQDNTVYNLINEFNKTIGDLKTSSHPKIIFEISLLKVMNVKSTTSVVKEEKVTNQSNLDIPPVEIKQEKIENTKEIPPVVSKREITNETVEEEIEEEVMGEEFLPFVKIPLYKKILVNNALALAEKDLLSELKAKGSQLQTFLLNKDFKAAATILLDGKIVGASSKCIIYAFPYDGVVEKADAMTDEIESLIDNMAGNRFKVVNITDANWTEIRPYYVKLMKDKKQIEILPEIDMKALKKNAKAKKRSKEIEDAINMFGEDLIEIK